MKKIIKHINLKKHSIRVQILIVNVLLTVLFLGLFTINSIYSNQKAKQESSKYSQVILGNIVDSFWEETVRLETFIEMCAKDRSVQMALSNRLTKQKFINYAREVSEKLSLIEYSLPYAEKVFAYVKNDQEVILAKEGMVSKDIFESNYKISGVADEVSLNLDNLTDGFHLVGNVCMHVTEVGNYGLLVIQINMKKFCNMLNVVGILPKYQIAILDTNGEIFSATDPDMESYLNVMDLTNPNTQMVQLQGHPYEISQRELSNGFRFLLVGTPDYLSAEQKAVNFMYLILLLVLSGLSVISVFLNLKIYQPLKHVVQELPGEDFRKNEIELIDTRLKELRTKNSDLSRMLIQKEQVQKDILLNYAVFYDGKLNQELYSQLQENDSEPYRVVVIAIQDKEGFGKIYLAEINDQLEEYEEIKKIYISNNEEALIVPVSVSMDEITEMIKGYLSERAEILWCSIGISDLGEHIFFVHDMYHQANERMLHNLNHAAYGGVISDEDKKHPVNIKMSIDLLNVIAKCVMNGDQEGIQRILKNIFLDDSAMTVQSARHCFEQLVGLFPTLIHSNSIHMDVDELICIREKNAYAPEYIYEVLLKDYKRLTDLMQEVKQTEPKQKEKYEIMEYLYEHFKEPISLDSLAEVFGLSPIYLSAWFKKNTGKNLSVCLQAIRMEEAKKIIQMDKTRKIAQVAEDVGICSISTFSRQFKKYTGCSPEQYRSIQS